MKTHDDIMNLFVAKRTLKFVTGGIGGIGITIKQYKWLEDVYSRTTGDYEGAPAGNSDYGIEASYVFGIPRAKYCTGWDNAHKSTRKHWNHKDKKWFCPVEGCES